MKINAFRRFFTEDYPDVPAGNWFSLLLGTLNQFTDPIITSLRNNLTFQDNFKCDVKYLAFTSNVELQVGTSFQSPPLGVTCIFVDGATLMGIKSRPIKPGVVGVTLTLSDTVSHNARLLIFQ